MANDWNHCPLLEEDAPTYLYVKLSTLNSMVMKPFHPSAYQTLIAQPGDGFFFLVGSKAALPFPPITPLASIKLFFKIHREMTLSPRLFPWVRQPAAPIPAQNHLPSVII